MNFRCVWHISNYFCIKVPELDRFASQFTRYEDSSDEDYYDYDDDNDKYDVHTNNRYCGFSQNFLDRGLPKPSKRITAEVCV